MLHKRVDLLPALNYNLPGMKSLNFSMLSIALIFLNLNLFSQKCVGRLDDRFINQRSNGVMVHYGINFYDLPEGYGYRPLLIAHIKHYPLFKTRRNINLAIDVGPQAGIAYTDKLNFEVGFFVSLNLGFAFTDWDMVSLMAGAGPHYISLVTGKQASGFIFSDNFLLAYRRRLILNCTPYELSFFGGFRHLSNASLKQPNGGIDNIITGIGFAKIF